LRAGRPLGWDSTSLEGRTPPRARLRLARGPDAPSGGIPPRSRAGRSLGQDSALLEGRTPPRVEFRLARCSRGLAAPAPTPPTGAFNVMTQCRRPSQRRILVMPLTPPGNHILALFRQPSWSGHPRHCATLCGKAGVSSVTLCRPLSYGLHAAPSKEDDGTLERGTDAYPALALDDSMTSSQ
jgi:hypothetical protein